MIARLTLPAALMLAVAGGAAAGWALIGKDSPATRPGGGESGERAAVVAGLREIADRVRARVPDCLLKDDKAGPVAFDVRATDSLVSPFVGEVTFQRDCTSVITPSDAIRFNRVVTFHWTFEYAFQAEAWTLTAAECVTEVTRTFDLIKPEGERTIGHWRALFGKDRERETERWTVAEMAGEPSATLRMIRQVSGLAVEPKAEVALPAGAGGPPAGQNPTVRLDARPAATALPPAAPPKPAEPRRVVRDYGHWSDGTCPLMPVEELSDASMLTIADTMIGRDDLASYPNFNAEFRRRGLHERPVTAAAGRRNTASNAAGHR